MLLFDGRDMFVCLYVVQLFFFSSRRQHTRCALVTGVQTCALPIYVARCPPARRGVVKPNNSSASWGIRDAHDRAELAQAIAEVQALDHDALVEPFLDGSDVEVPVITLDGAPAMLPMMIFEQADPTHLRTYQEKRDLVDR